MVFTALLSLSTLYGVVVVDKNVLPSKFVIYRSASRESDSIRNDNKNGTFVVLACMHAYTRAHSP